MMDFVKHHWLLLTGGAVGLYVIFKVMGGSSSSGSSNGSDYAATLQAAQQSSAQAAQIGLAQQQESDQMTLATNTLNAQTQVALAQSTTAGVAAVGQTLSNVIAAQSALPIAAINAASAQNQAALLGGAQVAAAGDAAVPGALSGAGLILGASYSPLNNYGQAVAKSAGVTAVTNLGSNLSSMTQAAASTANAALSRPQQSGGNSWLGTAVQGAAIAAMFL